MKCLYLVTRSLDPTGARQGTMDDAVEASTQRVRDHLRRPFPGGRNLLMKTAGNTVSEIVPASRDWRVQTHRSPGRWWCRGCGIRSRCARYVLTIQL